MIEIANTIVNPRYKNYDIHYFPHDGNVHEYSTGATLTADFAGGSGMALSYVKLYGDEGGAVDVVQSNNGSSSTGSVSITPLVDNSVVLSGIYTEATVNSATNVTMLDNKQANSFENMADAYVNQTTKVAVTPTFNLSSGQRWAVIAVAIAPRLPLLDKVSGFADVVEDYTSDDTFTVPAGVTHITVEAWSGSRRFAQG